MSVSDNLKQIRERIEKALQKSPFKQKAVSIMGASKDQSLNHIREAAELGVLDMGENYAQELLRKAPMSMDTGIRWHYIGRLQSNKIKHLLPYISSIDTVDSVELAKKISRVRSQLEVKRAPIPIMLQVNVGHERQKSGLPPNVIENLFPDFMAEEGVEVIGLMCIPPAYKDAEKARPFFKQMRELMDKLRPSHRKPEVFNVLNMGMSNDFEVAIEEGANLVRIGEALFGPRPSSK